MPSISSTVDERQLLEELTAMIRVYFAEIQGGSVDFREVSRDLIEDAMQVLNADLGPETIDDVLHVTRKCALGGIVAMILATGIKNYADGMRDAAVSKNVTRH